MAVSRGTVQRLVDRHEVRAIRIGTSVRFDRRDIDT
ncbi:MAG: excisionase family DNA-binding protein [Ilumatobacter sp.]